MVFLDETGTSTNMTRARRRAPKGERCIAAVPHGHWKTTTFIADNLSCHKVAGVSEASEAAGATLRYLPPYSPDLNPIEKMFAKLKALLRKAAKRTVDSLSDEIGRLLSAFSPAECQNYFASSGYNA